MNNIEDLTKILLDEKTTKEMAKELKISSSNLYYTINKLTKIGALRIVD